MATQPVQKLAKAGTHPENKPQVGANKAEKAMVKPREKPDITEPDRKTSPWDADDVLIVHEDTKQTRLESTQPGTKRKHTDEPRPVTVNKVTGKIPPVSLKRGTVQPPLPPHEPKTPTSGGATKDDVTKETTIDDTTPIPA